MNGRRENRGSCKRGLAAMGLTGTHEFPMGPADTGMQLGSSHLSGIPPRGLPASRAGLTNGADGERPAGPSQDAHVRESGSGEAPQGVPKNSSGTPRASASGPLPATQSS